MAIFDEIEAAYYCGAYASLPGPASGSFRALTASLPNGPILESGSVFAELRDASLREVDRLLFLAQSHYRRAFNMMLPSAAGWAQVTLYYATFFAASAIMGMFGAWKLAGRKVLDVRQGTPGSQELIVRVFQSTYSGSHRAFWDFYYANVASLIPTADRRLRVALSPVGGNPVWMIDARNDVNYDTFVALALGNAFETTFNARSLRSTLPGVLNSQFALAELTLELALRYARTLGVSTDALSVLAGVTSRAQAVKVHVTNAREPRLGRNVRRKLLTA